MSNPQQPIYINDLVIDPEKLTRAALNAARTMMGVIGAAALAIGIALLVWPGKSLVVGAAFAGAFFVISGAVRAAVGIFSRDVSTGFRLLNIIVGVLLLLGGIVALKNLTATAEVLTLIVVVLIGIGWLIDGIATLATAGRAKSSGLAIFRGIIGVLAGIAVLVVPGWTAFALIIMFGVMLIILGIAGLVQAFSLGKNMPKAATTIDQ